LAGRGPRTQPAAAVGEPTTAADPPERTGSSPTAPAPAVSMRETAGRDPAAREPAAANRAEPVTTNSVEPPAANGAEPVATNGVEPARPAPVPPADLRWPGAPGVATVQMDEYGILVDLDDNALRLFGYSRSEAIGEQMSQLLIPARLRAAHEAGLRRFRESGLAPMLDTRFQMPAMRRDGTEIQVELVVSRAVHDERRVFTGRLREIGVAPPVPGELALHADFHRSLVEQSPMMILVVDEHGEEVWSTPAAQALLGPTQGRQLTDLIPEVVHPSDADAAAALLARSSTGDSEEGVDLRMRMADGSWRWLSVLARNLLDHPAVHGVVYYSSDTTRARVAEQQRRVEATRLMTLLESLSVGVLLQDEHRRVVLANAAFVELFDLGLPPERLRDTERASDGGFARLHLDPETANARVDQVIGRGRPVVGEEIQLVNGRVLERDYTPITMDGTTLGHLWVYRDVTAQAEIRRSLEERNKLLSELSALKTEFVHVVSHELRTPLTSINTFANILDEEIELSADERVAAVSAVRRNADRMLALVADLILLAKLESGEIRLADLPVDLPALARNAAAGALEMGVHVTVDLTDGPRLHGDPGLLGQLVDTAVGVLVAGSAEGAQVHVSARPDGDRWLLVVTTSAAGAATSERLLSTRLPHPDAPDEQRTGALALMLARAIAARHGGDLRLALSQPGASISVSLPMTQPT
jgi:PAS domain S-box-containing protein